MFIVIILAALTVWGAIATIVTVRRDGYRAAPTDWSRATQRDPSEAREAESAVGYR